MEIGEQARDKRKLMGLALSTAMEAAGYSAPTVARLLGEGGHDVSAQQVNKWKTGQAWIPLELAQALAKVLGMRDEDSAPGVVEAFGYDPMLMVRVFGLAPPAAETKRLLSAFDGSNAVGTDLVGRIKALDQLDHQILEKQRALAYVEHGLAAQILLQAVLHTHKYGVAIWPVLQGPDAEGPKLHVSDRVDLRRLDGNPIDHDELWADLGPQLVQARAWESNAVPRWPTGRRQSNPLPPHPEVSRWNLRRLDAPRAPVVPQPHGKVPAIAFSATVSSTWVGNLASLVAMVLGYGFLSTTDMARMTSNGARFEPRTDSRSLFHDELLANPGERQVWAHAAKADVAYPHAPWKPTNSEVHAGLVHIHLEEEDELLEHTAEDRRAIPSFRQGDLEIWRRSRDVARQNAPDNPRNLTLPVRYIEFGSTEKWLSTFERAHTVLKHLESLGMEPWPGLAAAQAQWAKHDDGITKTALAWFRAHGTPFVYRTT